MLRIRVLISLELTRFFAREARACLGIHRVLSNAARKARDPNSRFWLASLTFHSMSRRSICVSMSHFRKATSEPLLKVACSVSGQSHTNCQRRSMSVTSNDLITGPMCTLAQWLPESAALEQEVADRVYSSGTNLPIPAETPHAAVCVAGNIERQKFLALRIRLAICASCSESSIGSCQSNGCISLLPFSLRLASAHGHFAISQAWLLRGSLYVGKQRTYTRLRSPLLPTQM